MVTMKSKTFFSIAAVVAMAAVIYVARADIVEAWKKLPEANPWLLLMLIPTQLLGYHANAKLYEKYFAAFGNSVAYKPLYRMAVELNFVNHVFPSGGLSGASYISFKLKKWGVSTAKATLAIIARFGMLFLTFQVLMLVGILALVVRGHAYKTTIIITIALGALFLIGGFFAIYIISSRKRSTALTNAVIRTVNWVVRVFHIKRDRLIQEEKVASTLKELNKDYIALMLERHKLRSPTLYSLLVNITEVASIYFVYLAFGQPVNFGAVIIAYGVANVAGAVAAIPGGIGVYESLMTIVMVSAGVPAGVSLSVTVVYRVINMAVFIPIGYVFYQHSLQEKTSE